MSVFVDENNKFAKFYGTSILFPIKNKTDFIPLMTILNDIPYLKIVHNLNLKLYDVFSQTMSSFTGIVPTSVLEWYNKNGGNFQPYSFTNFKLIYPHHMQAKDVLTKKLPDNFHISLNTGIKVYNNKLILKFDFKFMEKGIFSEIISELDTIYGNAKSKPIRYIILGYITNEQFYINREKVKILNSLIPKYIFLHRPDVYHYNNVDNFQIFSASMY